MVSRKKSTPKVEEVRPYVEGVAKNLVDKLYGPHGPAWGTKLTDIEDVLLDIRDILTEKMLDLSLAQQAALVPQSPPVYQTCPGCDQPLAADLDRHRIIQTRAGTVDWHEPEAYCNRCRRSFFPSDHGPGDGRK